MADVVKISDKKKLRFFEVAEQTENSNWELGDLLVELYGPSSKPGVHDGSANSMREFAQECVEQGLEEKYNEDFLRVLRKVSTLYPKGTRVHLPPWSTCRYADNPKMLKFIQREHEELFQKATVKPKLTQRKAIEYKEQIENVVNQYQQDKVDKLLASLDRFLDNLTKYGELLEDKQRKAIHVLFIEYAERIMKTYGGNREHIQAVETSHG